MNDFGKQLKLFWLIYTFNKMQLYHQTLIKPSQSQLVLALHLLPINAKESNQKPKQILLAQTSSFELLNYIPLKGGEQRYELKSFYREQMFSNICAVEALQFSNEQVRKDFVLITLTNGKYQVLEWANSQIYLCNQGYVFSDKHEVESGLIKPIAGHYLANNNQAKLIMIAAINWEFKIYSQTQSSKGVQLSPLLYFQQPIQMASICTQLAPGNKDSLFYSLRITKDGGRKGAVHKIYKGAQAFQEQKFEIKDASAHMLIARGDSFLVLGQATLTYYNKGKISQIKLPRIKQCLQSCYFVRFNKEMKQQIFVINQGGQMFVIFLDQNKANGCIVNFVDKIFTANQIVALDKNLFFSLSSNQDNFLFNFSNAYRIEERSKAYKPKQELSREELLNPKFPLFKEIDILGSSHNSRMIRDMKLCNVQKSVTNQIILTGGRPGNKKGILSILKYGLKVKEYLTVSFVNPSGIWSLKKSMTDRHHSYIVISFTTRKTSSYIFQNNMLSHTNELKIEEFQSTLHVNKFYDGSVVQVTASKIRHIQRQSYNRDTSIKGRIMKAISVSQGFQLLILLIGGFMQYYELNNNGQLKLVNSFTLDSQANFIDYAPPQFVDGKLLSNIIAIGKTNYNVSLYVLSNKGLELTSTKNIKFMIQSLTFLTDDIYYQIIIGTNSGKMVRFTVNDKGQLGNSEETQICEKSVKFTKITVNNKLCPLRICPDPNLTYKLQGQQQQCSLPLPNVDFATQIVVEGAQKNCIFITYFENYLRFIQISGFDNLLQQLDKQIELPGRKIVLCGDRLGVLSEAKEKKQEADVWKSVFCLFNPCKGYSMEKYLRFQLNEKCMSVCYVGQEEGKGYLCFGCVTDFQSYPSLRGQRPCIKVYSYQKDKDPLLNFLYSFPVQDMPTAMEVYLDKLLVGEGKKLILYDIYSSKLLLKASRAGMPSYLNNIAVQGEKIITSQLFNSFTVYRYNAIDRTFDYIAEDIVPRFLSTSYLLDGQYGVMAGGDKFGNLFISKFTEKIKTQFQTGGNIKYRQFTDCNKLDCLVNFYIGEVITSIQSGHLNERRPESIFYSSIDGRVGMFYPFESDEVKEIDLLRRLEEELRNIKMPWSSNHKGFRSFYTPSKGVIDGDLCIQYDRLSEEDKNRVANNLDVKASDIALLLTEMEVKFK